MTPTGETEKPACSPAVPPTKLTDKNFEGMFDSGIAPVRKAPEVLVAPKSMETAPWLVRVPLLLKPGEPIRMSAIPSLLKSPADETEKPLMLPEEIPLKTAPGTVLVPPPPLTFARLI